MDLDNPPTSWRPLFDEIAADPLFAVKSGALLDRGIQPDALARAYQTRFGLSFQDYLRMRRINQRFGPGVLGSSESPSATGGSAPSGRPAGPESPRQTSAEPPRPSAGVITFCRLSTPLGPMAAASTLTGIAMLEFAERRMLETQIRRLEERFEAVVVSGRSRWFTMLQEELNAYFDGSLREFSTSLDLRGSPFQMKVWHQLQRIGWGQIRSYGEQARAMGSPRAARAVGRANGENPIGILVPCHRVLGADGSMTGYGGRIWRKKALLRLESPQCELFQ